MYQICIVNDEINALNQLKENLMKYFLEKEIVFKNESKIISLGRLKLVVFIKFINKITFNLVINIFRNK